MTIGRITVCAERASANYWLRCVRSRRTGEQSWEIIDGNGAAVATGLMDRDEALRQVKAWERLGLRIDGGIDGHVVTVH